MSEKSRANRVNTLAREISLKDLWKVFVQRVWIMLAAMAVVIDLAVGYQMVMVKPMYESTAVLYVLKQSDESDNSSTTASDFNLALNVVNDCTFLLKSHAVVDQVLELVETNYSYAGLSNAISTNNPSGTRILEVTVVADTPTEAKQIVDTLCRRGANEITKAMGFQQVNLYEYGTMDNVPCNTMQVQRIVLYGLIAAILVYAVFLVLYLLDDSLETDESIEQQLGLKILGRIPSAQSVAGRRSYSYGSRRKK